MIQRLSVEDRIADGRKPPRWYPPNYNKRYSYVNGLNVRSVQGHGKYMGVFLVTATPFFLALTSYGIWLLYFGPAAHAH